MLSKYYLARVVTNCSDSSICVHWWNLAVFLTVPAAVIFLAAARKNSKDAAMIIYCAVALSSSPLAFAAIQSSYGGEAALSIAVFIVLCGDALGIRRLPSLVVALLGAALILEDRIYLPFVLLIMTLHAMRAGRRRPLELAGFLLSAALADAPHILRGGTFVPSPFAAQISVILVAVCIVALPFLFRLMVATKLPQVHLRLGLVSYTIILVVFVQAIFVEEGDPSLMWLAAEAVALLGIAAIAMAYATVRVFAQVSFAALVTLQSAAVYSDRVADITWTKNAGAVRGILQSDRRSGSACIITDATARQFALGPGSVAISRSRSRFPIHVASSYSECRSSVRPARIITMESGNVFDWGVAGADLADAVGAEHSSRQPLSGHGGTVDPGRTRSPQREALGKAFWTDQFTPMGRAKALTILAGHEYRIACAPMLRPRQLTFAAANPIPRGDAVIFTVTAERGAARMAVGRGQLKSVTANESTPWKFYAFPVAGPGCSDLLLTVDVAVPGRGIGAWGRFVALALD